MAIARVARASTERHFPTKLKWMERAKCLRKGTHHFWLPQKKPTEAEYQQVLETWCLKCPVRPECLVNVLEKEIYAKHTSRGVEGGVTPLERANLKRKIREAKMCVTEGVWRYLNNRSISRQMPSVVNRKYLVTLTTRDGILIYQNAGNTPKGARIIAMRELRRDPRDLVATIKDPAGSLIEVFNLSS